MKKIIILALAVLNYGCGETVTQAVNNQILKNEKISSKQAEIIFENVKVFPNDTQVSFAIINKGKASFYGVSRKNDTIYTISNYSKVFAIGSITKVFTATLLANFVAQQKIELEDDINAYLDYPLKDNRKLKFKSLGNHTSGLPRLPGNVNPLLVDPDNPYKSFGEQKLKEYLTEELQLTENPAYAYSNLGAGLLGYVLSKTEEKSFQQLLQENIFSVYGMDASTTEKGQIQKDLILGRDKDGDVTPNWDMSVLVGAGGIFSNVEDLSKFMIAQFNPKNKELALTRKKTVEVNADMDMGLGWHILKDDSRPNWFWHNGGTGGYSSSMAMNVENKNGIIILSNVSAYNDHMNNIDKMCFSLLKTL